MLPDIRLDSISNIDHEFIKVMTQYRKRFIELDNDLRGLGILSESKKEGAARCLSIARTNIETACMYAIKAICIMGENKE
jgi:hypothetical protein